ncbi:MAG: hypothetical protein JXQ76_05310, partial [Campylobacterales bacterium]|nr:hypothetical protein [Campylobacterales bacterium]
GKPKDQTVVTTNNENNQPVEIKVAPAKKEVSEVKVESISKTWLLLAFLGGIIVTLLFVIVLPKLKNMKMDKLFADDDTVFKTLYANMDKDPRIEQIVRDLRAKKQGDKTVVINKKEIKEILEGLKR